MASPPVRKLSKPTPLDYAVMIGGPLVFILIAVVGIRSLLGGSSDRDPLKLLHDGAVVGGMSQTDVLRKVGPPKRTVENINGTESFRYERGSWDSDRKTFVEEDAYVDFDGNERVSGVSFESRTPAQPK